MNDWTARVASLVGMWGAPPDGPASIALALSIALATGILWRPVGTRIPHLSRRAFVCLSALCAAGLSLGYAAHYLSGGPRIIDATGYYLQGRALSEGHFAWPALDPSAAVRGRFLVFHAGQIAGLFPPGYPLLLAAGFKLGAPMLVGPVLAAALALATYALALEASRDVPLMSEAIARAAATFSILSACLRYQTADTMSHGAAALWLTVAVTLALNGRRTSRVGLFALSGVAVGLALATRPVSAVTVFAVTLMLARPAGKRALAAVALGMVPGIALLGISQLLSTGSATRSTQLAYYAVSDGPLGCFRYGFGAAIGCLYEHGDYVRARLGTGYGWLAASGTTLRRVHLHLSDAFNAWPLGLAFVAAVARGARQSGASRWLMVLIFGQIAAYAPFYFDGNYPGGGARLLADVIPAEHVLAAIALARLAPQLAFVRRTGLAAAAMLAGFALHASFGHLRLRDREGGRPMFLDADLAQAGVTRGLVFVDTDHGFGLAHDPDKRLPSREVVIARLHADDHDAVLHRRLGYPAAFLHHYAQDGSATVVPYLSSSQSHGPVWSFEAEAEWPPLAQRGAWAQPVWDAEPCVGGRRVLEIRPADAAGEVTVALPVPESGDWVIVAHLLRRRQGAAGEVRAFQEGESVSGNWSDDAGLPPGCDALRLAPLHLDAGEARVTVRASGGPIALDRLSMSPAVRR